MTSLECQGPCLLHCYYVGNLRFIFVGIIIGLIMSSVIQKMKTQN